MFRIRRVYDDITTANKEAITQAQDILGTQIPGLLKNDIARLPECVASMHIAFYRTMVRLLLTVETACVG
jgi:hypothetical protein